MGNFLHSLPWTLALALAQAGEAASLPSAAEDATPTVAEDGVAPAESPASSPLAFGARARPADLKADLSLED